MMNEDWKLDGHERFKELGALANTGALTSAEWLQLESHLRICEDCRQIHDQYRLLSNVGMPLLAAAFFHPQEQEKWDDSGVDAGRRASIRNLEQPSAGAPKSAPSWVTLSRSLVRLAANQRVKMALAACLVIAVGWGAYRVGVRTHTGEKQASLQLQEQAQRLTVEKKSTADLVESQVARIYQM